MLAVFDLDGTLLDGDSTTLWLRAILRRSVWRRMIALLIAPIALPMVLTPRFRRAGASLFLWIATVGLTEADLTRAFADFAAAFQTGDLPLRWREAGLAAIDGHLERGERVIIVTAAPALLAEALIGPLRRPIAVIGSSLKQAGGGWVSDRHCRHREKCVAMALAGHGERWAYAYTDSIDDLPLLRAADQPALINGDTAAHRRLIRAGVAGVRALVW